MKRFLSAVEFNQLVNAKEVNCLGFLFGQTRGKHTLHRSVDIDTGRPLNPYDTPVKAFIEKASDLGFSVKQVSTEEETIGKTACWLWGWSTYYSMFEGTVKYDDFHVVRKNSDGTFEHKPNGHEPAEEIKDFKEFTEKHYKDKIPYIFVIE